MNALRNLYVSKDIRTNLIFVVNNIRFGIDISFIRQIVEAKSILRVPDQPSYIKGVISLGDKIIPVMDLRRRFGFKVKCYDDRTCFVIVQVGSKHLGLVVDKVENLLDIDQDETLEYNEDLKRIINVMDLDKVFVGKVTNQEKEVFIIDPKTLFK